VNDPVGVGWCCGTFPRVSDLRSSTLGCVNDPVGVVVQTVNRRREPPGWMTPRRLTPPVHKNPGRSVGGPVSRVLSRAPVAGRPVTIIFLAPRLPVGSSSLPADRNGSGRPCPLIWPCFRWGLPSRRVTPPLVRSYIKGFRPAPFHPYRGRWSLAVSRYPTTGNERHRSTHPACGARLTIND